MTDRATLEALLARVLKGTGPDRKLDAEIEACLTGRVTHPRNPGWTFEPQDVEWKLARLANSPFISQASRPAPPYTASLDAALTLLPEGWHWARNPGADKILVSLSIDIPLPDGTFKSEWISQTHADDKRALIAACLKAGKTSTAPAPGKQTPGCGCCHLKR